MKTKFSKLKKNDWFLKLTTGEQIFIKGLNKNYCAIKSVYHNGRIADEDFDVIKINKAKIKWVLPVILLIILLSSCGTYHHHDNDRCLNDSRIRHTNHKN